MFVLIVISDLDLTDMCHHFTELPNKTPRTPVRQSLNHMARSLAKLDCWCWVTTRFVVFITAGGLGAELYRETYTLILDFPNMFIAFYILVQY